MKEKAWLTYLSSDNYYVYLILSLYKNIIDTKSKYQFYCGVTKDVSNSTCNLLEKAGIKIIKLDTKIIDNCKIVKEKTNKNLLNYYKQALTKLAILNTNIEEKFDKIVYLDSDLWVKANIDELMNLPHMSAVINRSPLPITKYKYGGSVFCSGLFVWDFANNKNLGINLLNTLDQLDQNIEWHDQIILNYWFKDWHDNNNLHLDYTYGLMNNSTEINMQNVKILHMVNRIRDGWPRLTNISDLQPYFYEWAQEINKAIIFLKVNLPQLIIKKQSNLHNYLYF